MKQQWAAGVMRIPIDGVPQSEQGLGNPRVAYASWLMINFIPAELWDELEKRLDQIQQQAVHMTAIKLRESGMTDAADLIDPGAT